MKPAAFRLLLIVEFIFAVPAVLSVWKEVGGQGHFELIQWYAKLALAIAAAWVIIKITLGAVEAHRAWNRRTVAWLLVAALLAGGMGGLTYYHHLHEEDEESEEDGAEVQKLLFRPRLHHRSTHPNLLAGRR